MRNEINVSSYSPQREKIYNIERNYLCDSVDVNTETGLSEESFTPVESVNDILFSELPKEVLNDDRVSSFLKVLYNVYANKKKGDYTYLPLLIGEQDDDNIIIDWIYETIRISFYFNKERNSYSVTSYDAAKNSYSQKIEDLPKERYKEIAEEVLKAIA